MRALCSKRFWPIAGILAWSKAVRNPLAEFSDSITSCFGPLKPILMNTGFVCTSASRCTLAELEGNLMLLVLSILPKILLSVGELPPDLGADILC